MKHEEIINWDEILIFVKKYFGWYKNQVYYNALSDNEMLTAMMFDYLSKYNRHEILWGMMEKFVKEAVEIIKKEKRLLK
ncbi:MAG: hypothetical protein QW474_03785 [Candidatus Aenigmatarchaeota archaeon]